MACGIREWPWGPTIKLQSVLVLLPTAHAKTVHVWSSDFRFDVHSFKTYIKIIPKLKKSKKYGLNKQTPKYFKRLAFCELSGKRRKYLIFFFLGGVMTLNWRRPSERRNWLDDSLTAVKPLYYKCCRSISLLSRDSRASTNTTFLEMKVQLTL